MADIRVGTASWTDKTLIESGWYPPEANNPEKRLRYYTRQFPLVEVDSSYYALPSEQTAAAWAHRSPKGFTFNIKAFSLFTQHPTRIAALPKDLRPIGNGCGRPGGWARSCSSSRSGSRSGGPARITSCGARSGWRRARCASNSGTRRG